MTGDFLLLLQTIKSRRGERIGVANADQSIGWRAGDREQQRVTGKISRIRTMNLGRGIGCAKEIQSDHVRVDRNWRDSLRGYIAASDDRAGKALGAIGYTRSRQQ